MSKIIIGIVVALVVLVGGFYALNSYIYNEKQGDAPLGQESEPAPIIVEDFEGEADPDRMTLTMKQWIWISATENDGREVKPLGSKNFTLTFTKEGTFSFTTDCNGGTGSYNATSDRKISFTQMASTLMFCENSQEGEFTQLIIDSDRYHFTSKGELILGLKSGNGTVVFR